MRQNNGLGSKALLALADYFVHVAQVGLNLVQNVLRVGTARRYLFRRFASFREVSQSDQNENGKTLFQRRWTNFRRVALQNPAHSFCCSGVGQREVREDLG